MNIEEMKAIGLLFWDSGPSIPLGSGTTVYIRQKNNSVVMTRMHASNQASLRLYETWAKLLVGAWNEHLIVKCTCLTELEDDAYGPGGPMSGKPKPPPCKSHSAPVQVRPLEETLSAFDVLKDYVADQPKPSPETLAPTVLQDIVEAILNSKLDSVIPQRLGWYLRVGVEDQLGDEALVDQMLVQAAKDIVGRLASRYSFNTETIQSDREAAAIAAERLHAKDGISRLPERFRNGELDKGASVETYRDYRVSTLLSANCALLLDTIEDRVSDSLLKHYVIAFTMMKENGGGNINLITRLEKLSAVSEAEALGKAVISAKEANPEHYIHSQVIAEVLP